jgi:hypothetical protein
LPEENRRWKYHRPARFGDDRNGGKAPSATNRDGVKTLDACEPVLTPTAICV